MSLPHSFLSGKGGGGGVDWVFSDFNAILTTNTGSGPRIDGGTVLASQTFYDGTSGIGDLKISQDGTKMITIAYGGNRYGINGYTMSTPFDVANASKVADKNESSSLVGGLAGGTVSWDGHWLYLIQNNRSVIRTYYMSTAWDLTTRTYLNAEATPYIDCQACGVSDDGTVFWTYHRYSDKLIHHTLGIPYEFFGGGVNYIGSLSNTTWYPWGNGATGNIYGMYLSQDGKTLVHHDMSNDEQGALNVTFLSTPYDFSSISSRYAIPFDRAGNTMMGLDIHKDNMYIAAPYSAGHIRQIPISTV
jgi:hypothetical protein